MTKSVAVLLADGFEPLEVVAPVDALRRGGAQVDLVSIMGRKDVLSAQDVTITADAQLDEADLGAFAMLMVPGGSVGVENLKQCMPLKSALESALDDKDRMVAAICAGPTVLAEWGLLEGRHATCYPGCESVFPSGVYTSEDVTQDGNLLTATGPGTALAFGIAALGMLEGAAAAEQVAQGMLFKA